eukprot:COSAG05_NODE_188_length_14697_cov_11.861145_3_plen_54_part_00
MDCSPDTLVGVVGVLAQVLSGCLEVGGEALANEFIATTTDWYLAHKHIRVPPT